MDCALCPKEIQNEEAVEYYDGKPVHVDCYYDKLSDIVEERPIINPTRMRARLVGRVPPGSS